MKKYFVAGTDEEVFVGDVISTEFEKKFEDGTKLKRSVEFDVTEDSIPYLIDIDVLEEKDCEEGEDEDLIDFDDDYEGFKEAVAQDIEELNEKLTSLEERVKKLECKSGKGKKEDKK